MAKTLGVLGGMGPAAAAEFLRLLALHTPAKTDQEHIITYMVGDPLSQIGRRLYSARARIQPQKSKQI